MADLIFQFFFLVMSTEERAHSFLWREMTTSVTLRWDQLINLCAINFENKIFHFEFELNSKQILLHFTFFKKEMLIKIKFPIIYEISGKSMVFSINVSSNFIWSFECIMQGTFRPKRRFEHETSRWSYKTPNDY